MFFFFKQKTAYEMRISDWSSDVCSSDLPYWPGSPGHGRRRNGRQPHRAPGDAAAATARAAGVVPRFAVQFAESAGGEDQRAPQAPSRLLNTPQSNCGSEPARDSVGSVGT